MVAEVSGWLASALTIVFAWPQAIRASRAASTEGVSLASTTLMFQSGLLWTVYGALVSNPFIVSANVSVACAAFVTGFACRARVRATVGVALILGPACVAGVASALGPVPCGLMGVVIAGVMTLPQALLALRHPASLAAVSPVTYVLLAVNAGCWIVHGVASHDALVVAPNCVTLPASVLILVRRARRFNRRPAVSPDGLS